jgi:hypothetical protein
MRTPSEGVRERLSLRRPPRLSPDGRRPAPRPRSSPRLSACPSATSPRRAAADARGCREVRCLDEAASGRPRPRADHVRPDRAAAERRERRRVSRSPARSRPRWVARVAGVAGRAPLRVMTSIEFRSASTRGIGQFSDMSPAGRAAGHRRGAAPDAFGDVPASRGCRDRAAGPRGVPPFVRRRRRA